MVDFRYHLTSLVAVFVALAVGIVLGAGPLKDAIGNTLTGKVSKLEASNTELNQKVDALTAKTSADEAFANGLAPAVVAETLTDRRIAIIEIGTQDQLYATAVKAIAAGGGKVSTHIRVEGAWTDESKAPFRSQLSTTMPNYLDPVPAASAHADTVLSEALSQALVKTNRADANALRTNSDLVLELLAKAGLITVVDAPKTPADGILILGSIAADGNNGANNAAANAPSGQAATAAAAQGALRPWIALATQAAGNAPTLVLSAGNSVIASELRENNDTKSKVSTLTNGLGGSGALIIPMALGSTLSGTIGHYGPQATATPPYVKLGPPTRTPSAATVPAG